MKPKSNPYRRVLLAVATFAFAGAALAADYTTDSTGLWFDAIWNPGSVAGPTANTDTATINSGGNVTINSQSIDSTIHISSGATVVANAQAGVNNVTLGGNLTGSGILTKQGLWSLVLSGDNSGFSGTIHANVSNILFTADSAGSANAGWVLSSGANVVNNMSGTGHTIKLGSLAGTGGSLGGGNASGAAAIFEIGGNGNSTTFAGQIMDTPPGWGGGTASFTKVGSGTLVLSAANTYTGGTTVNSGVLELSGASGGTGRIRGALTVNPGATVRLSGGDGTGFGWNDARISSLTINGGVVASAGSLHIWNLSGGVTLTGGSLSSNGGVSSATGQQIEWGNTTLTSNASADTATVAGRINIRRDAASLLRVNVADGSAATDLLISAALTESASGCGLVKSGAGTLKLDHVVNLTGFITVKEGTLDLSSASLGEGVRISVEPGARFIPPVNGLPATAALFISGEKLTAGTWGAPGSVAAGLAQFESPMISGSTVMNVSSSVSNRERFKTLKYGVFSHYNQWATGTGDVNDAANAFNAEQYASDLATAGVQYVVWTAWHGNMFPMFPSQAAAKYGYGSRCSTRDTVSDMIDAVKARGIRVFLYTHPYQPLTYDLTHHNNFINELYAELVDRYGSRIDGLWIDENQVNSTQDSLVDYKRLMATIKQGNPDLVTMQNGWQLYTADTGGNETVGYWNFGQSQPLYSLVSGQGISPEDMLRTTVLQAAANFDGGGVHWSIDGVGLGGLEDHGRDRIFQVGRYLAPIRASVCDTKPSASFPPPYNGNTISYDAVNWVATTSTDESNEFIHVLKAPGGNTLTLPATADGKLFGSATLMASLQPGGTSQQDLGLPMTMIQTPRGIQLTLPSGVSWSPLDTVIRLNVSSQGGSGMVNDTSASITYSGSSWFYHNRRSYGEYNDDMHAATANGDSFTFTFSGTDVEYIASRAANRGPVAISIDGAFQTTVDLSTGSYGSRQSVFKTSGLSRGIHTLRAVKMGGTYMDADAFRVTELINDGDADLAASFPSTVFYGADSAIRPYGSRWELGNGGWMTPQTGSYPARNPSDGDYFDFNFTGTAVQAYLSAAWGSGNYVMYVDGVEHGTINLGGPATYSVSGLANGPHTLRGVTATTNPYGFIASFSGFTVTRPGLWNYQAGRGYGEIGDDVHYTDINPAGFSYNFDGSGVDVITTRDSDARIAYFSVSGMGKSIGSRYNNYSPTRQTGTSVFQRPNLAPGSYSVSVSHCANTSGLNFSFVRLAIDALRIYKGESLSAAALYWGAAGNGGSGTWDIGSTANWSDGGQATPWYDFGGSDYRAVFAGSAGTVNLASNMNVNRLAFKTAGYTLQGNSITLTGNDPIITADADATISSSLGGSAGLIKTGPGKLTLTTTPTYSGATRLIGGALSNGAAAGTSFRLNALSLEGATLAAANVGDISLGNFQLRGDVTIGGTAQSVISADVRVIQNETRTFNVGATGDASGTDLLISGRLGNQNNIAWGYAVKSGAGTMKISGSNELGSMTVNEGKLILEDAGIGGMWNGGLVNHATVELSPNAGSERLLGIPVSGNGLLTKTGGGTLNLSGSNTIGELTLNAGGTIFSAGNTTINGNLNLNVEGGDGLLFTGGVVTMNQLNFSVMGNSGEAFTIAGTAEVRATGGVRSQSWRGSSGMFLNGGTLHTPWLASNSASGPWWLNDRGYIHFNGTRIVATANQPDFIQLAGGVNYGNENFARLDAVTTFDTAGYNIGIGVTLNGGGGLTKSGSGSLTLSGANTYSGTTTVSAGKLVIAGSVANTTAVTIAAGAELEVSGTLAASAQIINHGTLVLTGNPQMSATAGITNYGTIINRSKTYTLPSNLTNLGTLLSVPSAPGGLVATPANGTVSLGWNAVSGATGYTVKQSSFATGPFSTAATTTTNSQVIAGLTNGSTYYFVVSANNATGEGADSSVISAVPAALPAPFATSDVGSVGIAGSASFNAGTYTLQGAGAGVYASTDAFRYVYQPSSGDCSITVRVQSLTAPSVSAKTGVMIRESLAGNARCAGVYVTPTSGIQFIWRTTAGSMVSIATKSTLVAPCWVRLTRTGNLFSAFYSSNGSTWTQLSNNKTISMAANATIGIATTSGTTASLSTGIVTNETTSP